MAFKVKKGTSFIKKELEAQERRRKESNSKIPRFFISSKWDADKKRDIPIVPLVEDPAYVMSHTGNFGNSGKMQTFICLNDPETRDGDCPICKAIANGATYPVARVEYIWLILDKTPYTRTFNGKEEEIENTLKLLPLSVKRASFLSLLDDKYGIKNRLIRVSSQGTGNATTWIFEYDLLNAGIEKNGKKRKFTLTEDMLEEAMERLPEEYQEYSFDEILEASLEREAQLTKEEFAGSNSSSISRLGRRLEVEEDDDEDDSDESEDIRSKVKSKLMTLNTNGNKEDSEDDDEEDKPKQKKPLKLGLLRKK